MKIVHFLDHDPSFSNGLVNFVKDLSSVQKKEYEILVISSAEKYSSNSKKKWKEDNINFLIETNLKKVINLVEEDDIIFFHVTSSLRYFTRKSKTILDILNKNALFIFHIDPFYAQLVGQRENLKKIISFVKETESLGITFSKEAVKLFKELNLDSIKKVQMGVNTKKILNLIEKNKKNERKFFLTSSTGYGIYPYIKGVDRFVDLVNKKGLNNFAFNLGYSEYLTIKNVILDREKTLEKITGSKAVIQLSRSELYGLFIIEAKLAKTPIIVSDIGGFKDNVKYGFRVKNLEEANYYLDLILNEDEQVFKIVEKNYKDALERENIENTWNELKSLLKFVD
jgi:glycosyltransferase involved in cell wall biosynthesis